MGPVTALAELAAFLRDLIATERAGVQEQAFEQRAKHAHDLEARLRGIIEDNEPVALENGGSADKGVE